MLRDCYSPTTAVATLLLLLGQVFGREHSCKPTCTPEGGGAQALSLAPSRGPVSGGQRLRVEGLGLASVSAVEIFFGKGEKGRVSECRGVHVLADNLIECTTSAATAEGEGTVRLRAPCPGGLADHCAPSRLRYEYVRIALASVTPDGGPPSGGTQLTLRGAGFDLNQLTLLPTVGEAPCSSPRVEDRAAHAALPRRAPPHSVHC